MLNENIRFTLDEVMKEKSISVRRLSYLSGVSRTYISQLRSGAYENPTIYIVSCLARALNVTVDELIKY